MIAFCDVWPLDVIHASLCTCSGLAGTQPHYLVTCVAPGCPEPGSWDFERSPQSLTYLLLDSTKNLLPHPPTPSELLVPHVRGLICLLCSNPAWIKLCFCWKQNDVRRHPFPGACSQFPSPLCHGQHTRVSAQPCPTGRLLKSSVQTPGPLPHPSHRCPAALGAVLTEDIGGEPRVLGAPAPRGGLLGM